MPQRKRTRLTESTSPSPSPSNADEQLRRTNRAKETMESARPLRDLKLHIVQAKTDPSTVAELIGLAENQGAIVCSDPRDAEVLVTNVGMRKRLERHVPWAVARQKAVVKPNWLRDSISEGHALPCGKYAALEDLVDETIINCPDGDDCKGCEKCRSERPSSSSSAPSESTYELGSGSKARHSPPYDVVSRTGVSLKPFSAPTSPKAKFNASYACERATPLVCPNEDLVKALAVIRKSRELESEGRSQLSYQRAIATIKAYPHKITHSNISEVVKLPYLGQKIGAMVREFHETGAIAASTEIASSSRFQALSELASTHGVGPVTARKLYDLGLRSIDDARMYYNVEKCEKLSDEGGEENYSIKVGLAFAEELAMKIPRSEVEEIAISVYDVLCEIQEGCVYTICGGHRRGKSASNDVDIVFTHPEPRTMTGLGEKLVRRLRKRGLLTHLLHLSGPITYAPSSLPDSTHKGWESLEKALTVMKLPDDAKIDGSHRYHRRVDLILADVNVYWCAVVGWTGSMMFERDLRLYTKAKKAWKFDSSGITRLSDSSLVTPRSEAELFELCGLPWVAPEMRNADFSA